MYLNRSCCIIIKAYYLVQYMKRLLQRFEEKYTTYDGKDRRMAQGYDVQAIMNLLRGKSEMNPDEHDGCYELMRETIEAYSKLKDFSVLDYKDLNLVYLTTVGTWRQGIEAKKNTIKESHLLSDDKEYLTLLLDEIWEKASRGEYTSNQTGVDADISIGLFGTGFFSFGTMTTSQHVQDFIRMCCDLLPMTDDYEMYDRAAKVLTKSFQGMRAASASMVLHCLHPYTFPVMNANMGNKNIFEVLGVKLYKRDNIETYIENCRIIKEFRDRSFLYKNYRIFDIAAWQIEDYAKEHKHGVFEAWEVVSEVVARTEYNDSLIHYHCVDIPKEILWFFRISGIGKGAMQSLVLTYQGISYDGYIRRDFENAMQIRLGWRDALADEFEKTIQDDAEHYLVFKRVEDFNYEISVIELPKEASTESDRVWLIAWNQKNWDWENFSEVCESTKNGKTFVDNWACSNTKPQIGEEVFLIKLGDEPRGIIGHGTVIRPSYEKEHYNAAKAAEGKKQKTIDVRFDRLIDYTKDKFIPQDELNAKCAGQQWSPQSSGIEIKPTVLPGLRKLWEAVTANHKMYGFSEMVSFLADYTGEKYSLPENAGDRAEYMAELGRRGKDARKKFVAFIKDIADQLPGLEYVSCSNWVNQGQVVERYIWAELKKREWKQYPQSVSISISTHDNEVPGDGQYISIRAETRDGTSKPEDYRKQLRLKDCALPQGMVYLVTYTNGVYEYLGTDTEKVKQLCEDGALKKMQILKAIDDLPEKDEAGTIAGEVLQAAEIIQKLYEYVMNEDDEPDEEEWWPSLSDYDPGITAEEYKELFTTESIVKRTWLEALYELYKMPGSTASCKQLGVQYSYSPAHYISYFSSAAQNIQKETGVGSPEDDKDAKCWPVLFQGKYLQDKSKGSYCYKMREPVKEAIEMLMKEGVFDVKGKKVMTPFDHNMILYGPPGTGKTYCSVQYAVAICDEKSLSQIYSYAYKDVLRRYKELEEEGRIAFTTFHQSYGYEEFIEGIKPKLDSESDSIGYTIEDGVFKKFCKRAKAIKVQMLGKELMKAHPRIWGMILGGTGQTELKRECFEKGEIRLGWREVSDEDVEGDYYGDTNTSWQAKHMVSDFKNVMEIGDLVVIEKSNTSIDAIGVVTGEYIYDESYGRYPRSRKVEWLVKDIDEDMLPYLPNGRKQLSRFSLFAFDYIGMDAISQILNENTNAPVLEVEQETKPYVFIIDEINRGNISKIFGELITLIEDKKRSGASEAMEAILPYSGEAFSVPNNVFILGTMNTADRSIALMDTALRRRFEFKEMMPNPEVLHSLGVGKIDVDGEQLNVARMLDIINKRIEYLFDREHTIGHAFFTKLADDASLETLASIFEKKVIPLLQEYFYEDYEKIQLVLGDDNKADEFKFILDRTVKAEDIFNSNPDIDLPDKGYSVQHKAFRKLESYKQIAKGL